MADQIRVLPDDVERDAHTGKHSGLRYRRFNFDLRSDGGETRNGTTEARAPSTGPGSNINRGWLH